MIVAVGILYNYLAFCPSEQCWDYTSNVCTIKTSLQCGFEVQCLPDKVLFLFPTELFNTTDGAAFTEEDGCHPTYDTLTNMMSWEANLGNCGLEIEESE